MTQRDPASIPVLSLDLIRADSEVVRQCDWIDQRAALPFTDDLEQSAESYLPDEGLLVAVNMAVALGVPLLITGEPGCGKTQLAYWIAFKLDLGTPIRYQVKSTSKASELLYDYDTVAYFSAAYEKSSDQQPLDRARFLRRGPLWQALESDRPRVVLIDEIDKAPRDFPNDLLRELAEAGFDVPETGQHVEGDRRVRPIVVITSNSERPLPAPFLRRCIYRHLELDPATIRRVVTMRRREFPGLSDDFLRLAVERFLELRKKNLRRKPGTSELLVWLRVLELAGEERLGRLEGLPYAGALLKDHHDLGDLG